MFAFPLDSYPQGWLLLTTFTQFDVHKYIRVLDTIIVMLYTIICLDQIFKNRNQSSDRLPDIMWCREPFFEVMNEIEDM